VQDTILADNNSTGMFADSDGVKATAARNFVTGNNYGYAQHPGATF
jgi:hypothetical protein